LGHGVPDVADRRVVAAPQQDADALAGTVGGRQLFDLAADGVELAGDVDDHLPSSF
jgi:hypothetical protein